ncbi:hypothetical protein HanRHA438_Chr13g0590881 [Helianthus annuus]|uniref:FAM178 family protein n=1 Tax=Helianthus annuus TaxID=4232 RepID=A0A251SQ88_HELAN|nr:uncharacterized protein LOC110898010 [Helianthus annuus]KAF5772678.1 putative FAM178 family protein [Helianthus annuus]KAJ0480404.1 hypothetical protein HanIR_Chr13g0631341 [Helianthus annuus]KAJ0497093.1 hypothetical protein HanHA89_Chr13g0507611 [Helianthus annuus]KAJ0848499.1 hypothetical protein HanPSC8_Chr13g0558221 [Helianthus annuus]KAJ0857493.1 hypothetical protein HanRHA438_Chr13g0590881 [Helianthus annuus]
MEDDPFDFESDILLATSPVVAPKRKKKVLGLDDLLVDHYKEKNRVAERESKLAKTKRSYNSDDEEDGRVAKLSKYVDECHEKMTQLGDEDDVSHWGLQVFGKQKTPQSFAFSELSSCSLFRLCVDHEVNSLVELSTESGETFFEGLLTNGWLLKLVSKCGEVEKSIAKWTFHLMLYSSKEVLRNAAVDFWCAILSLKNEDESTSIKIDWLPSYSELNGALETFGFVFHSPTKDSSDTEMLFGDSEGSEAPQNVRTWIKYVAACSHSRNIHCTFTTSEAEELLVVIICLLLDRQLLGLSVELNECTLALVNFFTDDEWRFSCVQVAKSVASRVPKDMNSLRAVECISVVHGPTKLLRSEIAFRILLGCFDKVEDEEEVVRQLTLINLKDKSCDLFKVYIYLVLTENWFLYNPLLEDKQLLNEMWGLFLRNCSCQINITDSRSYAPKVRSKASYLLQGTTD